MLKKLKKNNKKGFTLVELIVVLVILAILAALLIPALTGYIDKAKEKQIIAQTRQAVMAAQTLADEKYALGKTGDGADIGTNLVENDILKLAELVGKGNVSGVATNTDGVITDLVFKDKNSKQCTYDHDEASGEFYKVGSATP